MGEGYTASSDVDVESTIEVKGGDQEGDHLSDESVNTVFVPHVCPLDVHDLWVGGGAHNATKNLSRGPVSPSDNYLVSKEMKPDLTLWVT